MIDSGKRLVIFIDYVGNDTTTVDYIIPEFGSVRPFHALLSRPFRLTSSTTTWIDMGDAIRRDEPDVSVLDRQNPRVSPRIRPDVPHQP